MLRAHARWTEPRAAQGEYAILQRAAGEKNCGCGQTPCKTYGKKKEMKKEEFSDWRTDLEEKCWPGYEKKGMKTMFGKRYPNCVKKSKKKK